MKKNDDALLVIDLQTGVCLRETKPIDHLSELISLVNTRIQDYADRNRPVIFVQHQEEELITDSPAWQIIPQLNTSNAYFIEKTHANSFYQTELKQLLERLSISTIEICGAQTQYCVDTTVKFAHGLGYKVVMQSGATTTYDTEFMTANQTISFYESIWKDRFVTFFDK